MKQRELVEMFGWCQGQVGGWGGWIATTVTMVVFWAVVLLAAFMVWRGSRARVSQDRDGHDPMEVLDARFARGEIDEGEYAERRDVLRSLVP